MFLGRNYKLSQLVFSKSPGRHKIVSNILKYYAMQLGIFNVEIAKSIGRSDVPAFTDESGVILVNQTREGTVNSLFDNKYNLMNVLVHERLHQEDYGGKGYLGHAKVYLAGILHSTFKETSFIYKKAMYKSMSAYILMAYMAGNAQQKQQAVELIKQFNTSGLGITLKMDTEMGSIIGNKGYLDIDVHKYQVTGDGYNIHFKK